MEKNQFFHQLYPFCLLLPLGHWLISSLRRLTLSVYVSHCPVYGSYLKVIFVIQKQICDGCATAILKTFIWRNSWGSNLGLQNRPNKGGMSKPITATILEIQIHSLFFVFLWSCDKGLHLIFHFWEQQLQLHVGCGPNCTNIATNGQPHGHLFIWRWHCSLLWERSPINMTFTAYSGT